ncbi:MAG: hypothetical protein HY908_29975 [Myxococcales bacterium]|nr:hypothetical protein [Myxococcales bacterium]
MSEPFPFGLPPATAGYATLYALTLLLHAVLLSYVLAGAGWVAVHALGRAGARGSAGRVAALLVDWLPFALGGAITLGVAPLLFVQILYREAFYTSNLLLFWRWMAIVPALVAGFYGLYLAKSGRFPPRTLARRALGLGTFAAFAFVAFSFTDQHALALARGSWVAVYQGGPLSWREPAVVVRFGLWLAAALPAMAALVGWQLRAAAERQAAPLEPREVRGLAVAAGVGLVLAAALALAYRGLLPEAQAAALSGPLARPWLFVAAAGALAGGLAWVAAGFSGRLDRAALGAASLGTALAMLGVIAAREAQRLAVLDVDALAVLHARAAQAGGLPFFVAFLAVNTAVIAAAVALVRRGLRARSEGAAGTAPPGDAHQ